MAIEITEERKRELLFNFIENPSIYKFRDFKEIRDIIVSDYQDDYDILERIFINEKSRQLLSSTKLLQTIATNFSNGSFEFNLDEKSDDIFFFIKQFNLHEDKFFTNTFMVASLEFLSYILPILDKEVVNTEKIESHDAQIESLYTFFERIISKLNLQQADQVKYQNLFNKIEQLFNFNNYKNASIWFKFYFYFRDKKKFTNNIESNVINHVSAFIRTAQNPKSLKEVIESVLSIEDFLSVANNYLNELFNRCTGTPDFAIEFYSYFDETKKQNLIESWVSNNSNNAKKVIEGINNDIPDKINLATKILARANSLNNNLNEKKAFFNLLLAINLTKSELSSIGYTNQVASLIFNTNINLHNFGIDQLEEHREFIDTKSLRPKAEAFMSSILGNPNSYHNQIQNIIINRLGITTTFVDKFIISNQSYINAISNYLINSGNLDYYRAIISKLNTSTITMVNNNFINGINKHQKYYGIVNHINDNFYDSLADNFKTKIETLTEGD
mgnify:CR=1 FL=1|tara:strand:- start:62370 stop:63875 length:1506 start_codon:yes stop_codon:yes gene_type:complete